MSAEDHGVGTSETINGSSQPRQVDASFNGVDVETLLHFWIENEDPASGSIIKHGSCTNPKEELEEALNELTKSF